MGNITQRRQLELFEYVQYWNKDRIADHRTSKSLRHYSVLQSNFKTWDAHLKEVMFLVHIPLLDGMFLGYIPVCHLLGLLE